MKISCHGCGRRFRVRRERLPRDGARTRCPRCSEVLVIASQESDSPDPLPTRAATSSDQDLFDLPPADLHGEEDEDLFALGNGNGDIEAPGSAGAPPSMHDDGVSRDSAAARGGLWGWLSRLFRREP